LGLDGVRTGTLGGDGSRIRNSHGAANAAGRAAAAERNEPRDASRVAAPAAAASAAKAICGDPDAVIPASRNGCARGRIDLGRSGLASVVAAASSGIEEAAPGAAPAVAALAYCGDPDVVGAGDVNGPAVEV